MSYRSISISTAYEIQYHILQPLFLVFFPSFCHHIKSQHPAHKTSECQSSAFLISKDFLFTQLHLNFITMQTSAMAKSTVSTPPLDHSSLSLCDPRVAFNTIKPSRLPSLLPKAVRTLLPQSSLYSYHYIHKPTAL